MKKLIIIVLSLILLVSCNSKNDNKKSENKEEKNVSTQSESKKEMLKEKFLNLSNKSIELILNTNDLSESEHKKVIESESKNIDKEIKELSEIKTDDKEENKIIEKIKTMLQNIKNLYSKNNLSDITDKEVSDTIETMLDISDTHFSGKLPENLERMIKENMR